MTTAKFKSLIFSVWGLALSNVANIFIIRIIKSRRMRWKGHVPRMGEKRNAYRLLVGKPERKRPLALGRPIRRLVDNIRMAHGEVEWGVVDWIGLAQDRNRWRALVNSELNLRVPEMLGNYRVASRVVLSSIYDVLVVS
jgi:hypothetical protein